MQTAIGTPPVGHMENNIEALVDISTVVIDTTLPLNERVKSYLRQIKNPYRYKCGDITVRVSFADTSATLEERLKHLLMAPCAS